MVILVLSAVKPGLRGEISRWMIEPQSGVFVGKISARIREKLWEKVQSDVKSGSAVMVFTSKTEQGFSIFVHGDPSRFPIDYEGITLIQRRLDS